jgi:hypothetical protein
MYCLHNCKGAFEEKTITSLQDMCFTHSTCIFRPNPHLYTKSNPPPRGSTGRSLPPPLSCPSPLPPPRASPGKSWAAWRRRSSPLALMMGTAAPTPSLLVAAKRVDGGHGGSDGRRTRWRPCSALI